MLYPFFSFNIIIMFHKLCHRSSNTSISISLLIIIDYIKILFKFFIKTKFSIIGKILFTKSFHSTKMRRNSICCFNTINNFALPRKRVVWVINRIFINKIASSRVKEIRISYIVHFFFNCFKLILIAFIKNTIDSMTKYFSTLNFKFLISTISSRITSQHMFFKFKFSFVIFINKLLINMIKFKLIIFKFSTKMFYTTFSMFYFCFIYFITKTRYFINKCLIIILNKSTIFINDILPIYINTSSFSSFFNISNFSFKFSNTFSS